MKLNSRQIFFALPVCVIAFACAGYVETSAAEPARSQSDTVQATEPAVDVAALLEMQRSGQYASTTQQTLPGDAQSLAWKRYLESFSHPVPERYINDAFREK